MQLIVNYPDKLPDALQESAEQFEHEAKMAMAAKGNDFVIVSHVKGDAKEIRIGLGQATWKETEAKARAVLTAADLVQGGLDAPHD